MSFGSPACSPVADAGSSTEAVGVTVGGVSLGGSPDEKERIGAQVNDIIGADTVEVYRHRDTNRVALWIWDAL